MKVNKLGHEVMVCNCGNCWKLRLKRNDAHRVANCVQRRGGRPFEWPMTLFGLDGQTYATLMRYGFVWLSQSPHATS